MDVAVEADDDECKNRQENTGQRQTSQAGQEITAAVQAELRRENQVACTEIGSEEGKPQDEHIQSRMALPPEELLFMKIPPKNKCENKYVIRQKKRGAASKLRLSHNDIFQE